MPVNHNCSTMGPTWKRTIKHFFKTTTLHGFKYLVSPHCADRVGWLIWCIASASCAGVLCAVLWERLRQDPSLLALMPGQRSGMQPLPSIGLCPAPLQIAQALIQDLIPHQILAQTVEGARDQNQRLTLTLHCLSGSIANGCELYTRYQGQEWEMPVGLTSGLQYLAQVTFTAVMDEDTNKVVDGSCVTTRRYSRRSCMLLCREEICGCSDPLQTVEQRISNTLPPCPLTKINCLHSFDPTVDLCYCPQSCHSTTSNMFMQSNPMTEIGLKNTYDPIYAGLNITSNVVLDLTARVQDVKIFHSVPTENWLSLLSQLGGVFSMFLGVGIFSLLELLILLFLRLPLALRRPNNVTVGPMDLSPGKTERNSAERRRRRRLQLY